MVKLKYFYQLPIVLVLISKIICETSGDNYAEKNKKAVLACAEELKADPAPFLPDMNITSSHDPDKFSCMKKCIWEKKGYIDTNGVFIEAGFREDNPNMPDSHINLIRICMVQEGENFTAKCAAFHDFETCLNEEIAKLNPPPE